MSESIFRRHTFIRFPFKTLIYEINEVYLRIICLHHLAQILGADMADLSFRVWLLERSIIVIEEDFSTTCDYYHRSGRHAFYFHDTLHLLFFVLASEDWEANE